MNQKNKTLLLALLMVGAVTFVAVFVLIGYQRGLLSHSSTIEELDEEIRQTKLELEQKRLDAFDAYHTHYTLPMEQVVEQITRASHLAADYQNGNENLAEENVDIFSDSITEQTWYVSSPTDYRWKLYSEIAFDPASANDVQIVWIYMCFNPSDAKAIAFGHYDRVDGRIYMDHVYNLNAHPELGDTSPTAPEEYSDEEYTGGDGYEE